MDGRVNLIAAAEAVVAEVSGAPTGIQLEARRYTAGPSDLGVLLPVQRWEREPWGREILERFTALPDVESTSLKGQRLSIRFRLEHVAALARAIASGETSTLSPAAPPSAANASVDFCDPNANKALHVGHLRNLALGHALASLLAQHGYRVTRQSVVNDVGRSVFEALAGYLTFHARDTPADVQRRPDRFVGECYRKFVCSSPQTEEPVAAPDAPIGRELTVREDLAQRLLQRFCRGDAETVGHWTRLLGWAQAGQAATLARLGIRLDVELPESRSLRRCAELVELGTARGVFVRTEDAMIVYDTGDTAYPRLPLVRADGFPTEHMRALALWCDLERDACETERWMHVMGSEWVPSTVYRGRMMRELGYGRLFENYRLVPYEMVNVDGAKMKSGAGPTVYIDDVLDELVSAERVRSLGEHADLGAEEVARALLLGFFVSRPLHKEIEFATADILDEKRNPSLPVLAALARLQPAADGGGFGSADEGALRYAVMQSQRLERCLRQSLAEADPSQVLRMLQHLVQTCDARADTLPGAVVHASLQFGLRAIGLVSSDRA